VRCKEPFNFQAELLFPALSVRKAATAILTEPLFIFVCSFSLRAMALHVAFFLILIPFALALFP